MKQLVIDVDTLSCSEFRVSATEYAQELETEFGDDYKLDIHFPANISQAVVNLAVSRVGFNTASASDSETEMIYNRIGLVFNKLSRN